MLPKRTHCEFYIFPLLVILCKCNDLDVFHFSTYSHMSSFRKLHTLSLTQCIAECKIRTRCTSVNYKNTGNVCELLQDDYGCNAINSGSTTINMGSVYGCKSEWNMTRYQACNVCSDQEVCNILPDNSVTCKKDACNIPDLPENSDISGNMYEIGSKVCYKCRDGFLNVGGDITCSTCSTDGVWTAVSIVCEAPFSCDSGWKEYEGHCYKRTAYNKKWVDAQSICRGFGAYLMSIESEAEQQFAESNFEGGVWIGGHDMTPTFEWVWDSGSSMTYTHWDPGEPSSTYSHSDCMRVRNNWKWHDMNCYSKYESICEKGP